MLGNVVFETFIHLLKIVRGLSFFASKSRITHIQFDASELVF